MSGDIAIVGTACRYPDATSPRELWQNALAGRRAFRAIPASRLRVEEYAPRGEDDPDSTYVRRAALVEDFHIDRERFKISGRTARSTDHAHWLALDVASRALEDAGFPDGHGLPRPTTGVLVGNSLTGDSSRGSALRLRWPYVRRIVAPALLEHGLGADEVAALVATIEDRFKQPLPAFDEDTLAGGLSNTIGGRICNLFDLGGGGYTVDGACSSSLLAIAHACSALTAGDLDVALAGGVDVSLDPFELVGFARLGALARDDMRVYDRRPTGFLPGEGAGFVVLMRRCDAEAQGKFIHAVIRGWGISSDGHGGMTRPQTAGHQAALARCYARAEWGIASVGLFEGHGTGTAVGDEVELAALAGALREAGSCVATAIGSIKSQIGHTKAAAGIAGLLKMTLAVREQVIPPLLGMSAPHGELARPDALLRAPTTVEAWPADKPLRAGVSAVGFGGINVHVAIEGVGGPVRRTLTTTTKRLAATRQDAELFVLSAADLPTLATRAMELARRVVAASGGELTDLAAAVARKYEDARVRCAVVGASPEQVHDALQHAAHAAALGEALFDPAKGVFVADTLRCPRVAYLFTGQGAPVPLDGGALGRRFESAERMWALAGIQVGAELTDTRNAQPRIVAASVAAASVLESFGLDADLAIGHSLGELSAQWWAGTWTAEQVVELARTRGQVMAEQCGPAGAMLALACDAAIAELLIEKTSFVIAAYNGPRRLVVAGARAELDIVARRARAHGVAATLLTTSHAFHSPLMSGARDALARALAATHATAARRPVVSTVTGRDATGSDPAELLLSQLVAPVRFTEALTHAGPLDLLIECGPGTIVADMTRALTAAPVIAVDACGDSLRGLLSALGAAWALRARIDIDALFADRFCKPVRTDVLPTFFGNPCEDAEPRDAVVPVARPRALPLVVQVEPSGDVLAIVRRCLAEATELPLSAITDDARVLEDLHLSSITVAQVVATIARVLGSAAPTPLAGWARATVAQIAEAFLEAARPGTAADELPGSATDWIHAFEVVDEPCASPQTQPRSGGTWTWYGASDLDRAALEPLLEGSGGGSALVVRASTTSRLLDLARVSGPIVVFDPDRVGSGFCRSLYLETSQPIRVIAYDALDGAAASAIRREVACATEGFRETHVARNGDLTTPVLAAIHLAPDANLDVSAADVVLVTGGGKGIAAECALELGVRTGCSIITLGRSTADADPVLAGNLARFTARGVRVHHCAADLTDERAVASAIRAVVAVTGPITMIVHAAGINDPISVAELTAEELRRTSTPKITGLTNVLAAVERSRLRKIISFGSIIARSGLPGEAHYAVANDALRRAMVELQSSLPHCACMTLEWSAWANVGMAERIGRLDALLLRGLRPITVAQGVSYFLRAIADGRSCVISSRLGDAGVVRFRHQQLPFSRFVERVLVHVPDVELVCEVEITPNVDLYTDDHVLDGVRVFPAVMQVEAACQVASALVGERGRWRARDLRFPRAILIPDDGIILRIACCRDRHGDLEVLITSSADTHSGECMRVHLERTVSPAPAECCVAQAEATMIEAPYKTLLPQSGRFARIAGYRSVTTTACSFDVAPHGLLPWFAHHYSQELVLADPGSRDAVLHGIQIAVPHERLVPTGAASVELAETWPTDGRLHIHAREVSSSDGEFVWNIAVHDAQGNELERWSDVRFRSLGRRAGLPRLAFRPWFERHLHAVSADVRIRAITSGESLSPPVRTRRPDGRPESPDDGMFLSITRAAGFRLVVESSDDIACDLEVVTAREPDEWHGILCASMELATLIASSLREPFDRAATRVWAALECCAKLGQPGARLLLASTAGDCATLTSGDLEISTFANAFDGTELVGAVGAATRIARLREAAS